MILRWQRSSRVFIFVLGSIGTLVAYLIARIGPESWAPWPDNIGLLYLALSLVVGCLAVRGVFSFGKWLCVLFGTIIGTMPLLFAWVNFATYRIADVRLSIMDGPIRKLGNYIVEPADYLFLALGASFDISSADVAREYLMLSWIAYTLASVILWTLFFLGAYVMFEHVRVKGDPYLLTTHEIENASTSPEKILAAARYQRKITLSLLVLGGIGLLACWPLVRLAPEDWKQLSDYLGCVCFVLFSISLNIAMRNSFLRARRCILSGMIIGFVPTLLGLTFELICRDCAEISNFIVSTAAAISAAVIAPTACFLPTVHFPFPPGPIALDREHLLVFWLNYTLAAAAFWTLISIFTSQLLRRARRSLIGARGVETIVKCLDSDMTITKK